MEFVEPLKVSQGPDPHILFIQAQLSEFKSKDGKELPDAIIKSRELPRMQRSVAEAKAIENTSSSVVYSSTAASLLSIFESFVLSASLNQLWGMINAHQMMVYLPMLPNLKYPANAAYLNE